jgi:hypothetical protein
MTIKYTNIFHFKTLQNIHKLGFFGLKIYHLATRNSTPPNKAIGDAIKIFSSVAPSCGRFDPLTRTKSYDFKLQRLGM